MKDKAEEVLSKLVQYKRSSYDPLFEQDRDYLARVLEQVRREGIVAGAAQAVAAVKTTLTELEQEVSTIKVSKY